MNMDFSLIIASKGQVFIYCVPILSAFLPFGNITC